MTIPKYTTHIGSYAFYRCTNLTRIVIPENVAKIADRAFPYCTALSEIQVDAGNSFYCTINGLLLNRDGSVLYQCPPVMSGVLTIPEGVEYIGSGAFSDTNLAKKPFRTHMTRQKKQKWCIPRRLCWSIFFRTRGTTIICKIYRLSFQT